MYLHQVLLPCTSTIYVDRVLPLPSTIYLDRGHEGSTAHKRRYFSLLCIATLIQASLFRKQSLSCLHPDLSLGLGANCGGGMFTTKTDGTLIVLGRGTS